MKHSVSTYNFAFLCNVLFITSVCSTKLLAEVVRPLRTVRVPAAESQVDEAPDQGEASWVIVHLSGLKVINVQSGAETDVMTVRKEEHLVRGKYRRSLSTDGKVFGYQSTDDARVLTVTRVADGRELAHLNSLDLLKVPKWVEFMLGGDATYCVAIAHQGRQGRDRIVRVDFFPSPRVTASVDLGPLGHDLFLTPNPSGLAVVIPSDDSTRAPGARWLQVFDHQLRLQHKEKVTGPMSVLSASELPNPLIAIRTLAGDPGVRSQGERYWLVGELVRGQANSNSQAEPNMRRKLRGNQWIMAAAFSHDGKWLVTSPVDSKPTLALWSTVTGNLHGEFQIEGGHHELPGHQVISRLAFSKSGRFLCASDASNAYLLEFSQLVSNEDSDSLKRPQ